MSRMLHGGLQLSDEDDARFFNLRDAGFIGTNMCYGCMTYEAPDGKSYIVPADETIMGVRAKLTEFEETGIDPFVRDYEKAPPYRKDVRY